MAAAQRLLDARPGDLEDHIRQNIVRLLDKLAIDNRLGFRTGGGVADIFLPRRRIFIETKAVGLADDPHRPQQRDSHETPFEQLGRYLLAEMRDESSRLPFDDSAQLPWTGIVTDGRVWHAWRFDQQGSREIVKDFRPANSEELIVKIRPILDVQTVGKPWIPADPVALFGNELEQLRDIHANLAGRTGQTTETKMQLWLDMLRGSGMAPETSAARTRLFTAHCFLVALARGVVHTLLNPDAQPDPGELLGSGFPAWIIEIDKGRSWAQALLGKVHGYEWRRTAGDVLRPLYESFVDDQDRRDFGEVYTPDWLAEMMANEVLDEKWCVQAITAALAELRGQKKIDGIGVLDPTCGSGTFLFHCARCIIASQPAQGLQPGQLANVVCRLVHGIDIHPVAVEFSRATLLRALPASPSAAGSALAIYQGDALMLRQDHDSLFKPGSGEILIRTPSGDRIILPRTFTEHIDFPDMLRRMVDAAATGAPLAEDIRQSAANDHDRNMVDACHQTLAAVIKREGNSVWTWYISNVLGPDRLASRKVNRIVANPPWVKLANIQNPERKRALENMAGKDRHRGDHLDLWTGGRQAPHFDIAQLFICHARKTYLARPQSDPGAWVTKAAAIRSGNWQQFRTWHAGLLARVLDFSDAKVFGGGDARRSCVLFELRRPALAVSAEHQREVVLKAQCSGKMPHASASWTQVQSQLVWRAPEQFARAASDYAATNWRQGATVAPKVLTIAARTKAGSRPEYAALLTARSNKPPWNALQPQTGELPAQWLAPLLTSRQLLPFAVASSQLQQAIVPCDATGNLLSTEMARQSEFWAKLDDLYREYRGQGGNTPKTLLAQIDYNRKLSVQLPLRTNQQAGHMVIYPASGDVMRAARLDAGSALIDSKVYRLVVASLEEARYLTAVLNAPALEAAFRACRTSGRDFHKNPWQAVPVPAWQPANQTHRQLAQLAAQAESAVATMQLPAGQIAASKRIREKLAGKGIFAQIDSLARIILPDHC